MCELSWPALGNVIWLIFTRDIIPGRRGWEDFNQRQNAVITVENTLLHQLLNTITIITRSHTGWLKMPEQKNINFIIILQYLALNRMITIIQDNVCSYVSPSSVPDFWFTTESILKTLPGNLVAFVITKDKPIFSPSQLHTSQPVKLCANEFLFPPNFAAITYEGNV